MRVKLNGLKIQGKNKLDEEIVKVLNDRFHNHFAIVGKKIVESWEDEYGTGKTHWAVYSIDVTHDGGVESVDIFSR